MIKTTIQYSAPNELATQTEVSAFNELKDENGIVTVETVHNVPSRTEARYRAMAASVRAWDIESAVTSEVQVTTDNNN